MMDVIEVFWAEITHLGSHGSSDFVGSASVAGIHTEHPEVRRPPILPKRASIESSSFGVNLSASDEQVLRRWRGLEQVDLFGFRVWGEGEFVNAIPQLSREHAEDVTSRGSRGG